MKLNVISAFGHQLTRFGVSNCYLVRESDGFTLIDTSLPGSAPGILSIVGKLPGQKLRRILLTHAHGDHIGSLDVLAQKLGSANLDVAISERDARLLPKPPKQDRSLDPGEPQCKIKGSLPGALTVPTHLVKDDELFGSLRCVATPGHTPGHFSFVDERDGTLYAGDALVTVGGKAHLPGYGPWYFPFPGMATWDRPLALASAHKLLALRGQSAITRIAPGHGPVLSGGRRHLENAIFNADRNH